MVLRVVFLYTGTFIKISDLNIVANYLCELFVTSNYFFIAKDSMWYI